jgi:tetratricopeptide (TPR) repeat protein
VSPRPLPPPAKRRLRLAGLTRIEALNREAETRRGSDVPGALALAGESERLARISGHRGAAGTALLIQSNCHADQGHYAPALACARKAFDDLSAAGDAAGRARSLNLMGNVFMTTGRYDRAMAFYRRGLRVLESAGLDASRAHRNIGVVHFHTGRHAEARRSYETALSRALAAGEKRWAGLILMDLGNCTSATGNEPAALNYYLESLAIHEREGHLVEQAYVLRNLGDCRRRLGQLPGAREALARAIALAKRTGEQRLRVYLFISLAELETAGAHPAEAERHYLSALKIAQKTGNRAAEAQVLTELGALAAARRKRKAAGDHYRAALEVAAAVGEPQLLRRIRAALAGLGRG